MQKLWLDLETFSEIPIKNGIHVYAEGVEIMLFAWAIDEGPVNVHDLTADYNLPTRLLTALSDESVLIYAHNSHFDRTVLRHAHPRLAPDVTRWRDTMVQALAHGLPGALGGLCEVLGVPQDKAKDKEGKALIQLFCKPRPKNSKLHRATSKTHPEEWRRFVAYAGLDIEAMREVYKRLPKWNYQGAELALWHRDQQINDRGVCMDVQLAQAAIEAVDQEQKRLAKRTQVMTDGEVQAATQRDALIKHIVESYGVELPDMQRSTLERRITDPDLPSAVKELLAIRLQASTTSTSKYKSLMKGVSSDGRLRGTLQFCGASRTGRWAGRLFQPQNLPRPSLEQEQIDEGIEALKAGCADLLFDNIMELTSSALRGCIMAPEGKKLVVSDLSNIEGRKLAWLAGEQWKLDAFREYDEGTGPDLYKLAYARAYGIDVESVTKGQRQIGKVLELACLAPDTLVLTDKGYKPLINVSGTDLLWDGEEWVRHEGLIYRGYKETLSLDGVQMTPDHLILTPVGWKQASLIDSSKNMLLRSQELASENLPSSKKWVKPPQANDECLLDAPAELCPTQLRSAISLGGKVRAVISALKRKPVRTGKSFFAMRTPCPTIKQDAGYSTDWPPQLTVAISPPTSFSITMAAGEFTFASYGEKTNELFYHTLANSRALITRCWKWIASTITKDTNRAIFGSYPKPITTAIAEKSPTCKKESKIWNAVYDIAHAGPRNRFTIKTDSGHLIVHNCGYGGGVAAFLTFALVYGLDLDELANAALPNIPRDVIREAKSWYDESVKRKSTYGLSERVFIACDSLKRLWRRAHPATCDFWYELERTVRAAIATPQKTLYCGYLKIRRDGAWLRIQLPSGRALCYPSPSIEKGNITYQGVNSCSRKWQRLKTYGGKLVENVTQAAARDVLAGNMPLIEDAGYSIVLTVHDEVICEAPDTDEFNDKALSALLSTNPEWAPDIPLNAGGFEAYHYKKE